MRNASHKTRIGIIREHVNEWRKAERLSREAIALMIVEAHQKIDGPNRTGIHFDAHSGDSFTTAKTHADRIFRWLDDETKDTNFLPANFEDSILFAMPMSRRLACINDLYRPLGIMAQMIGRTDPASLNATIHLVSVGKEASEAVGAIADLVDGVTPAELARADRELAEAEEAIRAARADVRAQLQKAGQ
jgi:hypothetical protein